MRDDKPTISVAIGVAARLVFATVLGTAGVYLIIYDTNNETYRLGAVMMLGALIMMAHIFDKEW